MNNYTKEEFTPDNIDVNHITFLLEKIERKLDKLTRAMSPEGQLPPKELLDIPVEEKQKMKAVLEESFNYLSEWEMNFLKSMITYPRWSVKQEHNWNKILLELSTRKGE